MYYDFQRCVCSVNKLIFVLLLIPFIKIFMFCIQKIGAPLNVIK